MKICLIGCGRHPHDVYVPSFKKLCSEDSSVELTACCDLDEERALSMQEKCSFKKAYTDYHLMLEQEKPDALFVITAHPVTTGIIEDVAQLCSCPIMIEKPPGATYDEAKRIYHALDDGKRLHQIAFNRHYMESYLKLKEKIQGESLQHIEYTMIRMNRTEPFFYVTAIHGIDIVRFLIDSDYESCDFMYQDLPDLGENCYNMHIMTHFESGATGYLSFLVQSGFITERATATCRNKAFILQTPIWDGADTPGSLKEYKEKKCSQEIIFEKEKMFITNGFYDEVVSFLNSIKTGNQNHHASINTALQSMEIADCLKNRVKHYEKQ